jgi:hypothetical protein
MLMPSENNPTGGFDVSGAGPGKPSGGYTNSDHIGHLLFYGHPTEAQRTSTYEGRESYTVASCEFVVCLSHHKAWSTTDVSGAALVPRLLSATGKVVAVRLILGEAKGDRNPPILPEDATAEELVDVQAALTKYAAQLPGGRVVFGVVEYNADHPEPEASAS